MNWRAKHRRCHKTPQIPPLSGSEGETVQTLDHGDETAGSAPERTTQSEEGDDNTSYAVVQWRDEPHAEAEEIVEGLTLHGRWDDYDRPRKAAVLWAWTYLRAQDVTGREIASAVADELDEYL